MYWDLQSCVRVVMTKSPVWVNFFCWQTDIQTKWMPNPLCKCVHKEIDSTQLYVCEEIKCYEDLILHCMALIILHMHTRVAGSGFHLPSDAHTALIFLAGTNPGLHLKNISAPSSMFWYGSITPFSGTVGSLQLAVVRRWRQAEVD